METVGNMKLYTFEEVLDKQLGKKGTPRRDAHEMRVEEALHAYRIGEAIKKARLKQNLTGGIRRKGRRETLSNL